MEERITMVGITVLAVGILLFFGFMPLIGESADKVSDDYDDTSGDFRSYEPGDRVTVYGKVTDIEYNTVFNFTAIELDHEDSKIYVNGDVTGSVEKGEKLYIKCFVDDRGLIPGREYLRSNPEDIHRTTMFTVIFTLVILAGIIVIIVGIREI